MAISEQEAAKRRREYEAQKNALKGCTRCGKPLTRLVYITGKGRYHKACNPARRQ